MNFMHLVGVLEIISGILINIFIGQLAKFIFRKDGTGPRIPFRIIGIYFIINGISKLTIF
jgi:hypothetical protein